MRGKEAGEVDRVQVMKDLCHAKECVGIGELLGSIKQVSDVIRFVLGIILVAV